MSLPKRVEMLVAMERLFGSKYRCVCDCGNERTVLVGHFNTGSIKSCGCHVRRHGHGGKKKSRTYISYGNMIARCHNPRNKRYADYGGRGILVCEPWRNSFFSFLSDMGECPQGHTIDRQDNSKGYSKENCRWVTRSQNQRNRNKAVNWIVFGKSYGAAIDAAKELNVSSHSISAWCRGRLAEGRWYEPKPGCRVEPKYAEPHPAQHD
jgi:hypothetical protein